MVKWETPNAKYYLGQDGLRAIRSEKIILVTSFSNHRSKILQIIFWKDGSIFIDFPFFSHSDGIVSLVTYPANANPPIDLSLLDGGKATSHLVKYSHHPDGKAHFSQDGKVFTKIKKICVPLEKINGHLFTVQIQGLASFHQFDAVREKTSNPLKKTFIEAVFSGKPPDAIKIVGMIYSRRIIRSRSTGSIIGPVMPTLNPQGAKRDACICSSSIENPNSDLNLLLMCESIPRIDKDNVAALSFVGGFDDKFIVEDRTKDTTFLAFTYPMDNINKLAEQIGSIDFIRN
jgi:hypothetical protein